MFSKVLIANRGEIAVRIIRTCRSWASPRWLSAPEADRTALHAQIADETVCVGPAPSKDSYLNMQSILAACDLSGRMQSTRASGLSENAAFARLCARCG